MSRIQQRRTRVVGLLVVAFGAVATAVVSTPAPAAAALPSGAPALSAGVDGQVYATLVVGDRVYVGGSFSQAQTSAGVSVSRTNLAAFDLGSGALIGSWQADVNGVVRGLATSGSYLYVGGSYTRIGGVAQARLARVSLATGAVDSGFRPQLDSAVRSVAVGGGSVFAGGQFAVANGVSHDHLAKFDLLSGTSITSFTAAANGNVDALALSPDGTRLAVGGSFTALSGASRTGLGLVNPTTGTAIGPGFSNSVNPMLTVSWSDDGTALFGGSANYNNLVARWNASTGARSWSFSVGGDVQAIGYYDGTVYAGFHDNYQNDTHTKLLAVDAASGAISTNFRPTFNQFWGVRSISAGAWGLIIGGQFTDISGVWAHNWAIWPAGRVVPTITVASPRHATYGTQVHISVTVPYSTGTVSLSGITPTAVQTLAADGSATFALPRTLVAGEHTLTVHYSGDQRHTPSTTTRALTVTKAGTTIRTTITRKATTRRPGKVKVTVASKVDGGEPPVGSVRLRLTRHAKHRILKPVALHGDTATFTLPRLSAGFWRLDARYTGDANHKAASHHQTLKVAKKR